MARGVAGLALGLVALGLAGCTHTSSITPIDSPRGATLRSGTKCVAQGPIPVLAADLAALAETVSAEESQNLAACAIHSAQLLAREYRMARSPLFHNLLVNLHLRKRGLCYHFAEDLLCELQSLPLTSLTLHWGVARAGTLREHNCIVVTARNQPFAEGIVLDAWRHPGRLFWTKVKSDRYPWQPVVMDPAAPTNHSATPTAVR